MRSYLVCLCILPAVAVPASAANVNLQANLVNSCVLSVSAGGTMTSNAAGTQIGSENAGGSAAVLGLVAIGALPTITFAVPSLSASPAGWIASHTNSLSYSSIRGANQAYTSSASSVTAGGLTDTFTVHGKVDSATGFDAGNYMLTTVVTCAQ